jgi:phage-related protein
VWLRAGIKTPPFSEKARLEAGFLIRMLQAGEQLGMPQSRPMPGIAPRCHELRVSDGDAAWRIVYRTDGDAILIVSVFAKKSRTTPKKEIDLCRSRLAEYDRIGSP